MKLTNRELRHATPCRVGELTAGDVVQWLDVSDGLPGVWRVGMYRGLSVAGCVVGSPWAFAEITELKTRRRFRLKRKVATDTINLVRGWKETS